MAGGGKGKKVLCTSKTVLSCQVKAKRLEYPSRVHHHTEVLPAATTIAPMTIAPTHAVTLGSTSRNPAAPLLVSRVTTELVGAAGVHGR